MRGKGLGDYSRKDGYGITPAYAGKSFAEWIDEQGEEDHPRLCGEKATTASQPPEGLGSPPPMRGKVPSVRRRSGCCRITPAYAGKSAHSIKMFALMKDHPRLCGEKLEVETTRKHF